MNCNKTQKQLSAYLDGELSVRDADLVREHLGDCAACAALLAQDERIQTAYAMTMKSAPSNFTAQVMARIDREESQPQSVGIGGLSIWDWLTQPAARFAVSAAAIVAVAAAAYLLFPSQPENNVAQNAISPTPVAIQLVAENLDKAAAVASAFVEGCEGRVLSAAKGEAVLLLQIQLPENRVADFRKGVTQANLNDVGLAQTELAKIAPARDDLVVSLQSTNLGLPSNIVLSPLPISSVKIGATRGQSSPLAAPQRGKEVVAVETGKVIVELEIRVSETK